MMYTKEMQVGKKKRRKKHKPSIIQKKDGRCYLCMLLDEDNGVKKTQEHHIFGGPNRDHSEETGLKVYGIVLVNDEDDITWTCETDPLTMSGFNKAGVHIGAMAFNVLAVTVQRATVPGFPVKVKVTSKTNLNFIGVMRSHSEGKYRGIPFEFVDSL